MSSVRLLGIVGSLRKASWNRLLLRAIAETLPAEAALSEYDRLGDIPLFDPDSAELPEPVVHWQAAIAAAHGLIIVTPEYNYSIPGFLKNAIDWATRPLATSPLRGKPVALASSSTGMSGGMRAQYHLRQIMVFTNSPVLSQPEVIIPRIPERFDATGTLTDPSTRDLLSRYGAEVLTWVRRFT